MIRCNLRLHRGVFAMVSAESLVIQLGVEYTVACIDDLSLLVEPPMRIFEGKCRKNNGGTLGNHRCTQRRTRSMVRVPRDRGLALTRTHSDSINAARLQAMVSDVGMDILMENLSR